MRLSEKLITVETNYISAIVGKKEIISLFEVPENSTKELKEYDLSNTVLISISDPTYKEEVRAPLKDKYCKKFKSYIKIQFWDIQNITKENEEKSQNIIDDKTIEKLEYFIKENKKSKFVINCNAGISRSAGVGLLVEYILNNFQSKYEFKTCYEDVISKHYRYSPNLIILDRYLNIKKNNN